MKVLSWKLKSVAMLVVLTMSSTSMAPEARAAGPVRDVGDWIQAHQVEVTCISAGIRLIVSGGTSGILGGVKCLVRILGINVPGLRPGSNSGQKMRGAPSEPIAFNSIEEFLAHPRVSKADKDLVRSRYLPGVKRLESEIGIQVKRIKAESLASKSKLSDQQAEEKLRKAVDPLVRELSAPLASQGIKVIVK